MTPMTITSDISMDDQNLEVNSIVKFDPKIFLAKVIAHGTEMDTLSEKEIIEINEQLANISHLVIRRKARDFSAQHEIRKGVSDGFCLSSIGLEYASKSDVEKGIGLLKDNRVQEFFRIGNTLLTRVIETAEAVREKAILTPQKPSFCKSSEEIELLNFLEKKFVDALLAGKIIIDNAGFAIEVTVPSRPIATLADLAIVKTMVQYLDRKIAYLEQLPAEKIFTAQYLPDSESDLSKEITCALMINLALYRRVEFQIDFDEDLTTFRDVCYDAEEGKINQQTVDFLLNWISTYLQRAHADKTIQQYAVDYWQYCIHKLEEKIRLDVFF